MRKRILVSLTVLAALLTACQRAGYPPAAVADTADGDSVARGEYLVRISGCNDCHTAGYAERQGEVDTAQWLAGSPVGYHGPWGTTYASNLRLRMQEMDEAQWLEYSAHLRTRPIMPDFALRAMTEADRRAIYRFVHSLGPVGEAAPASLPPGHIPRAPYFGLVLPPPPAAPAAPETAAGLATTAAPAN